VAKSKYLPQWTAVAVLWLDAHGQGMAWGEKLKARDLRPAKILSVGQVFAHTKHGITVSLSHDTRNSNVDSYMFIPTQGIVSIVVLGTE
jgi:hypothetical protein